MEMHELATKLKELKTGTDSIDIQAAIQKAIDKIEEKIGEKAVKKKEVEKKETVKTIEKAKPEVTKISK